MYRYLALKLSALVFVIVALIFSGFAPAHAATGTIAHDPAWDYEGPTCDTSEVGFSYSITGTTNDIFNFDIIVVIAVDGHWEYLDVLPNFAHVGNTYSGSFSVMLTGITARPVIVQFIDPDLSFDFEGKQPVYEFAFDPASVFPACAGLPYTAHHSIALEDGRINDRPEDNMQTAAIYCTADGVTIWSVKDSVGKFAFTATRKEIDAVPKNPVKNTLIKQAKNIALYRLTTGEMQVNAPNNYVFIWKGC